MNSNRSKITSVFSGESLLLLLAAGCIGEIVLEIFAWWVLPELLGKPMRPDILVHNLGTSLFEVELSRTLAVSIHLALGMLIFPVVFALARAVIGFETTLIPAVIYGVVLWLIAQTTLAPLAGRPFMLGLIPYTWASLFGHVLYTVVIGLAYDKLARGVSQA